MPPAPPAVEVDETATLPRPYLVEKALMLAFREVGLVPKVKLMVSFYVVACRIDTTYDAALPPSVRHLLDSTSFISGSSKR